MSGEWHDGLPCPTVEGEPGGESRVGEGQPPSFCRHVLHSLVTDMNMPSFCKSARLSVTLSSSQQGRFGNYSQGGGFRKRGGQPSQAAHKILGYNPIQRSFVDLKYVIRANDLRLQRITVVEHRFLIPEGSPVPEGIPLADSSSSHQATEAESDSGLPEEGFDAFDQARSSADPVGDLGDLDLSEADFLLAGTASQAEMGLKRRPPTSLFDLIEGQSRKEAPRKS